MPPPAATRRAKNPARLRPSLPLQRSTDNLPCGEDADLQPPVVVHPATSHSSTSASAAGNWMPSPSTSTSMQREDTSMIPLQKGEVRVPLRLLPPPIRRWWADVTQTSERFPTATFVASTPLTATPFTASRYPPPSPDDAATISASTTTTATTAGGGVEDNHRLQHGGSLMPFVVSVGDSTNRGGAFLSVAGQLEMTSCRSMFPNGFRLSDLRPAKLFPPPPPPLVPVVPTPLHGGSTVMATSFEFGARRRAMRWYQVVDLWCREEEGAVEDAEVEVGMGVMESGVMMAPPPSDATTRGTSLATPAPGSAATTEGSTSSSSTVKRWVVASDACRAIVSPPPRPPPYIESAAVIASALTEDAATLSLRLAARSPYSVERWMSTLPRWWAHIAQKFDLFRDSNLFIVQPHVASGPVAHLWAPQDVLSMIAS